MISVLEFVKLAYGDEEAERVLQLAKKKTGPKGMTMSGNLVRRVPRDTPDVSPTSVNSSFGGRTKLVMPKNRRKRKYESGEYFAAPPSGEVKRSLEVARSPFKDHPIKRRVVDRFLEKSTPGLVRLDKKLDEFRRQTGGEFISSPRRSDALKFFSDRGYRPPSPMSGKERKFFESVVKGHELDELRASRKGPKLSFLGYGHKSPDVIMHEGNRLATAPEEYKASREIVSKARRDRGEEADIQKILPYYRHGETRLGRAEKRHVTRRLEEMAKEKMVEGITPKEVIQSEVGEVKKKVRGKIKRFKKRLGIKTKKPTERQLKNLSRKMIKSL